jgi:GNAT superfamily N-acetyltransferase
MYRSMVISRLSLGRKEDMRDVAKHGRVDLFLRGDLKEIFRLLNKEPKRLPFIPDPRTKLPFKHDLYLALERDTCPQIMALLDYRQITYFTPSGIHGSPSASVHGSIEELYVIEEYRRQGVGSTLLDRLIFEIRQFNEMAYEPVETLKASLPESNAELSIGELFFQKERFSLDENEQFPHETGRTYYLDLVPQRPRYIAA